MVYPSRSWNRFDMKHKRQAWNLLGNVGRAPKKVVLCCVCTCAGLGGSWVTLGSSMTDIIGDSTWSLPPASATSSLRNGERLLLLDCACIRCHSHGLLSPWSWHFFLVPQKHLLFPTNKVITFSNGEAITPALRTFFCFS